MMRRALYLFLCLLLCLSLVCCGEDFTHCEMTLPLGEDFYRVDTEDFDAAFTNGEVTVGMLRISFIAGYNQGIPETMTAAELARFWQKQTGREGHVYTDRLTPYYTYLDGGYFYMSGFYRTQNAYFIVLLACSSQNDTEWHTEFENILDGATFKY